MGLKNEEDDFLDFEVIEEKSIDLNSEEMLALGLTLNQALSEENIPLARDILLEIVKKTEAEENEKEDDM